MRLEHMALIVDDYDTAIEFFVGRLGFELVEDSPARTNDGRAKRWVVVRPPGAQTGLLLARADGERQARAVGDQFAGRVGLFLRVEDFDAQYARMREAGVEFVGEPRREPYGRVAVFVDVAGNRWDLLGPRPTLYEVAGGDAAFLRLAEAHHARCLADPELNHPFSHPGQHPRHIERLAAYWAEVLGGPSAYSRECGNQSALLQMHAGNGDMSDLGRRFVACFDAAMDDAALPADPEFRAALHAYMEWAVADVLIYSPPGTVVAPGTAMPRWGWDGLQAGAGLSASG
jgi:hemoglobin